MILFALTPVQRIRKSTYIANKERKVPLTVDQLVVSCVQTKFYSSMITVHGGAKTRQKTTLIVVSNEK